MMGFLTPQETHSWYELSTRNQNYLDFSKIRDEARDEASKRRSKQETKQTTRRKTNGNGKRINKKADEHESRGCRMTALCV